MELTQEVRQVNEARSWEELISDGLNFREEKDNSQWSLGDLALEVSKSYGDDSIGKYAYAISVVKKTLMNYRTVSSRFTRELRTKYRKLSYTHFAALSSLEEPEAWLEKADDNNWSVETMKTELRKEMDSGANIKEIPPKVYKCPECGLWRLENVSSFEVCRGHYHIKDGQTVYV